MPDLKVGVEIDNRLLIRGIQATRQFSKRALPDTINSALLHIAFDAQQRTPFVEPTTIDAELAVVVAPVIGATGKKLKGKWSYGVGKNVVHSVTKKEVPLAALIIQKMARTGESLGKGFPLSPGMFKGIPRKLAAQKMAAMVDRLIKNRHRSTHVLAAGWREAIDLLKKFVSSSIRGQKSIGGQGLGSAQPAIEGIITEGMIENNVGAEGPHAASLNVALQVHAAPALQAAVDEEGRTRLRLALQKMGKGLEDTVKPHWG